MSRPTGLTIILFIYPDLTVGARLFRAFGALSRIAPELTSDELGTAWRREEKRACGLPSTTLVCTIPPGKLLRAQRLYDVDAGGACRREHRSNYRRAQQQQRRDDHGQCARHF